MSTFYRGSERGRRHKETDDGFHTHTQAKGAESHTFELTPRHGHNLDGHDSHDDMKHAASSIDEFNVTDEQPRPLIGWGISWATPALSVACVGASLGIMLGHHFYYRSLEGTTVLSTTQQQWAIRVGTGLATLNKIVLLTMLGMVATQRVWMTARSKFVSVEGLDCMFRIINEPSALLSWEVWRRGKVLLILALACWLTPLSVVVTPATLSVESIQTTDMLAGAVPTVNMADPTNWYLAAGVGRITNASIALRRLFSAVYTSSSFLPVEAPAPNATYDLSFWGPSYACHNLSDVASQPATWDTKTPSGNYSTYGEAWDALITKPVRNRTSSTMIYKALAPIFTHDTIFVWTNGRNDAWEPNKNIATTSLVCQLYNTSYDVSVTFTNGAQTITPSSVQPLHLMNFTASGGAFSVVNKYAHVAATYVTQILFSDNFLEGELVQGVAMDIKGDVPLMQSRLAYCPEIYSSIGGGAAGADISCPAPSLAAAIEDLSRNFTYSVMAPGYSLRPATADATLAVSSRRNVYVYNRRTLLGVYLACFLVGLAWLAAGGAMVWANGYVASASFSSIMVATRNGDLDRLAAGYYLGAEWLPREIGDQRVMFGSLGQRGPYVHAGFGLEGTVTPLKKGQ